MSWRRYGIRRAKVSVDQNQKLIVDALLAVGASVQSLASVGEGTPDLLCGFRKQTFLLEVKREVETFPGRQAGGRRSVKPFDVKLRQSQVDWHNLWKGRPVAVVHTPVEALKAIGAVGAVA